MANQKKGDWCPNEKNFIRSPSPADVVVARRAEELDVNRQHSGFFDSHFIPKGIRGKRRVRLTCATCKQRFLGEVVYDTMDGEFIGYKVPAHKTKVKRKTVRIWDKRNRKEKRLTK